MPKACCSTMKKMSMKTVKPAKTSKIQSAQGPVKKKKIKVKY